MSLRALASLLGRRLSARGAQAQRSAAAAGTRPAPPSLHTLRDLDVGDGAIGAFVLMTSLGGLVGFLYFKQDTDESAGEEITLTREEETVKWRDVIEPSVMAKFTRKDGTFAYLDYIDYLNSQMNYGGKPLYDKKWYEKKEIIDDAATNTDEDNNVVDEAAMKAKFEDWMKEHGRRYRTEEEKAHRYENFKKVVKDINKYNAKRGARGSLLAPLAPNELADYNNKELGGLGTLADESHWEGYLDHIHTMMARGNDIRPNENACEAVKKRRRELFSMRDKAMRQASCRQTAASQKERAHVCNFDFLVDLCPWDSDTCL